MSTIEPLVSVVMGVFNGGKTLRVTLDSIRAQTMQDWELIVVDDASTDQTHEILLEYCRLDPRIRVIRKTINGGLTLALIEGCNQSRGEYIARHDVGDTSDKERLQKQFDCMSQQPDVVALGAGIERVGPKGEFLGYIQRNLTPPEVTREFLETGKSIVHAVSMFRRSVFLKSGGYRPEFRVAQDIDLWYRLSQFGLIGEHPDVLARIAIDIKGISAVNSGKQHCLADIAKRSYLARTAHIDEKLLLEEADRVSQDSTGLQESRIRQASKGIPYYFIGSELYRLRSPLCRGYLLFALKYRYRIANALGKLVMSYITCPKINQSV
jgi:glycosyltransferase involved in cell wall biosynthesis